MIDEYRGSLTTFETTCGANFWQKFPSKNFQKTSKNIISFEQIAFNSSDNRAAKCKTFKLSDSWKDGKLPRWRWLVNESVCLSRVFIAKQRRLCVSRPRWGEGVQDGVGARSWLDPRIEWWFCVTSGGSRGFALMLVGRVESGAHVLTTSATYLLGLSLNIQSYSAADFFTC